MGNNWKVKIAVAEAGVHSLVMLVEEHNLKRRQGVEDAEETPELDVEVRGSVGKLFFKQQVVSAQRSDPYSNAVKGTITIDSEGCGRGKLGRHSVHEFSAHECALGIHRRIKEVIYCADRCSVDEWLECDELLGHLHSATLK